MSANDKSVLTDKKTEKDSVLDEDVVFSSEEETAAEKTAEVPVKQRSRVPMYAIGAIVALTLIISVGWWLYARQFAVTDDAFIEGNISLVSPKITARVARVHVKDNQAVKKGELIIELEASEPAAKLAGANAALQAAVAGLDKARANMSLTRADSTANLNQATSNLQTAQSSIEQSKVSTTAKQNLIAQAKNRAASAAAGVRQMESQIPAAEAAVAQARAQVSAVRAQAEVAKIEHDRDKVLFDAGDVSKQKLDLSNRELSMTAAGLIAAEKQIEIAAARVNTLRRQIEVEQLRVREAETDITAAQDNYRQSLSEVNVAASQADESAGRLEQAKTLPTRVAVNQSEVSVAEANVAQAQAAVNQADIELQNTRIYAPQDGFIAQKAVQDGQLVQPDQALLMVTQPGIWIIANYKETQIESMQPGQPVDIYVDAYPSAVFRGKVESFQAGTGSHFSVLPSDNATGNFVKVVQRISVKIVFDEMPDNKKYLLVPGMSVTPKVHVR